MTSVLYTSDLHGNEVQYRKLIHHAIDVAADIIIIGGDISPKCFEAADYVEGQRDFLQHKLPEHLTILREKAPNLKVFLMMGNDDCSSNLDVLEKGDPDLYQIIHRRRLKLTGDIDIVGYSSVPITPFGKIPFGVMPFGIKDWEKFDFSEVPPDLKEAYLQRKKSTYQLDGFKSSNTGLQDFSFNPATEGTDSIQKDLNEDIFTKTPSKTLYVIHTPPNNTNLDLLENNAHVGSMALRSFIENNQPFLTLHGHIHETVDVSGDFKQKIGKTLCLSSGNNHTGPNLALLVFDLENPEGAQRIIL